MDIPRDNIELVPAYNITSMFLFISMAYTITGKFSHALLVYVVSVLMYISPYMQFLERLEVLRMAGNVDDVAKFCY